LQITYLFLGKIRKIWCELSLYLFGKDVFDAEEHIEEAESEEGGAGAEDCHHLTHPA
jgi:hypothetical protein